VFQVKNEFDYLLQKDDVVNCVMKPEFWSITDQGHFLVDIIQATFLGSHVEYIARLGNQTFKFFDYNYYENGLKESGMKIRLNLKNDLVKVLSNHTQEKKMNKVN